MDAKTFEGLVVRRLEHCGEVLCSKGEEYSRNGDRLHNFKSAGRKRNVSPVEALMGMKAKHDVSIDDLVSDLGKGIIPTKAFLDEKIGDSINYLLLLEGLIEERRQLLPPPSGSPQ